MRRVHTLETTIMEQKDQLELARQVFLKASYPSSLRPHTLVG
jgi:hypothetical protein